MTKETKTGIFDQFTGKYQLSKTLRFELKPVPRTIKLLGLDNDDVFPRDKKRVENYAIIKNYIDKLHSKFINAVLALPEAYIDVTDFVREQKNIEENEEELIENDDSEETSAKSKHHKKITDLFNQLSELDKINGVKNKFKGWIKVDKKNNVSGKLFKKELIDILRREFQDELETDADVPVLFFNKDEKGRKRKLKEVFNSFGKDQNKEGQDFTTYFSSTFHDNRRNYYKADGKAGRVATRIADENLKRFSTNLEKFNKIKSEHPELLVKFNAGWKEYFAERKELKDENWIKDFDKSKWQEDVFGTKYKHFLQADINRYNYITRKLNKDINESGIKVDKFLKLHKQIHGEVRKHDNEFYVDRDNIFSSGDSFIKHFIAHSRAKLEFSRRIFSKFFNEQFSDPKNVFLSSRAITTISSKCFTSWYTFGGEILDYVNKMEKGQRKKLPAFVGLQTIKNVLDAAKGTPLQDLFRHKYFEKIDPRSKQRKNERERLKKLQQKLKEGKHWQNFLRIMRFEFESLVELYNDTVEKLLQETVYKKGNKDFSQDERDKQVGLLFDFAESANGILNMTKYFALRKRGVMVEDKKYANRDEIHEQVENYLDGDDEGEERCLINQYYKTLKNFVTKKPWLEDKIILNFDNGQFLQGWPKSQEKAKGGIILRKKKDSEWLYYLAVLRKQDKFFDDKNLYKITENSTWQKMNYIQLQNPYRMLPKLFITPFLTKKTKDAEEADDGRGIDREKKGAKEKLTMGIEPSDEILNGYIAKKHTKDNMDGDYLQKYLEYLKDSIKKYYRRNNLLFPDITKLSDTSPFYSWVEKNVYNIEFVDISEKSIDGLIINAENKKQVYLFQIYNKDFELDEKVGKAKYGNKFLTKKEWRRQKDRKEEEKKQGRDNLETMFFKLLFDPKNLKNERGVIYKLSGGAKMFYRPASENLEKKKIKGRDGREKEVFDRQRYKEDKFFLHIPIVMNFANKREGYKINMDVNELIAQTPTGQDKFRIIALDRGEKNLAYLAVLDENGKILEMPSLNRIERFDKKNNPILEKNQYHDENGNPIKGPKIEPFKDYHNLLDQREIERLKARKSWERIERIADLKEGYLGFVVNKIANLVIQTVKDDKVPIVVFENLNAGMKQGRIMIEKQVYSRVEEKITKKLNYLVDKKLGNFLEAWQLTPEIKTFSDIKGIQVGIIFYVNPAYTSATCPACGFRRRKYIKTKEAKDEFGKIKITFDGRKYKFEYSSDVKGNNKVIWDLVYSDVRRAIWDRRANNGKGDIDEIADVTKKISDIFEDFKIVKTGDVNDQLQKLSFPNKEEERKFWARLCKWFHYIIEVRNSVNKKRVLKGDVNGEIEEWGKNKDFILCPCCHFDSENAQSWNELKKKIYIGNDSEKLNFNGDANGAYNIGRKGIIIIEKIKKYHREFDKFKNYWNIQRWPKKDEKLIHAKNNKEYTFTILKDEKKQPYYCLLESKKEDFKSVPAERKIRKYPDLFISDFEWDEATTKWAKENGTE